MHPSVDPGDSIHTVRRRQSTIIWLEHDGLGLSLVVHVIFTEDSA